MRPPGPFTPVISIKFRLLVRAGDERFSASTTSINFSCWNPLRLIVCRFNCEKMSAVFDRKSTSTRVKVQGCPGATTWTDNLARGLGDVKVQWRTYKYNLKNSARGKHLLLNHLKRNCELARNFSRRARGEQHSDAVGRIRDDQRDHAISRLQPGTVPGVPREVATGNQRRRETKRKLFRLSVACPAYYATTE